MDEETKYSTKHLAVLKRELNEKRQSQEHEKRSQEHEKRSQEHEKRSQEHEKRSQEHEKRSQEKHLSQDLPRMFASHVGHHRSSLQSPCRLEPIRSELCVLQEPLEPLELCGPLEPLELYELLELREPREPRELREPREPRELRESMEDQPDAEYAQKLVKKQLDIIVDKLELHSAQCTTQSEDQKSPHVSIPIDRIYGKTEETKKSIFKTLFKYYKRLQNHALFVEAISCMMFHFVGSVSPTPWSNGIILTVLVYYCAKISGGHLNPAVSWTFCLLGHIDPIHFLAYAISQVIGCIMGAILIALLVPQLTFFSKPSGPFESCSGCFTPSVSTPLVFAWETLGTTSFIVPIFSVVWYTQHKRGYGNTGPLIVGLSLVANALACSSFTGGAFNPARMASQVVFSCPYKAVYSYIFGEFLGATLAALIISPFYGVSHNPWYKSILIKDHSEGESKASNEDGTDD